MRSFSWYQGRAWIADAPDAWPSSLPWAPQGASPQQVVLPASAPGAPAAVAVQRMCQTASGGSFFARIGGVLVPTTGTTLEVTVTPADDPDMDLVLRAVLAGIDAMPTADRPVGRLAVAWFVIHPVDLKPWAWRNATATMVRLFCADIAALDDAAAAALALDYRVGCPSW